MRSKAFQPLLLIAVFASCSPHVTLVEEGSGGGSGDGSTLGQGTGGGDSGDGSTPGTGTGGGGAGDIGGNPSPCDHALPPEDDPEIMCPYTATVANYCSKGGCHGTVKAGGLDLRLSLGFISRLVDQPAIHRITCGLTDVCDRNATPPTCASCATCPSGGALLIDSTNVDNSWILTKMAAYFPPMSGSTNVNIGCGDQMPSLLTSGISAYSQADKDCLTKFFRKIAKTEGTFPCGGGGQ